MGRSRWVYTDKIARIVPTRKNARTSQEAQRLPGLGSGRRQALGWGYGALHRKARGPAAARDDALDRHGPDLAARNDAAGALADGARALDVDGLAPHCRRPSGGIVLRWWWGGCERAVQKPTTAVWTEADTHTHKAYLTAP